jgi:uncharacterized protein (TIGR03067 family)
VALPRSFAINPGDRHRVGFPAEECTMRVFVVMSLAVLTITFGGAASAGKRLPTNKEKIIGAWKLTRTTVLFANEYVFTFTSDGHFTVDIPDALEIVKGNYEVDGDTLKVTPTSVDGEPKQKADTVTVKIKSLSAKEVEVEVKEKDKIEGGRFVRVAIPSGAKQVAELDKKKIQGFWEHIGTELDGILGKKYGDWGIVEFKGDHVILIMGAEKKETKFILNATRKLKAIQFNGANDQNLFAYELEGDRLRLCQAAVGQFPEAFKTKGVGGSRIEEFKRVKKGQ